MRKALTTLLTILMLGAALPGWAQVPGMASESYQLDSEGHPTDD